MQITRIKGGGQVQTEHIPVCDLLYPPEPCCAWWLAQLDTPIGKTRDHVIVALGGVLWRAENDLVLLPCLYRG